MGNDIKSVQAKEMRTNSHILKAGFTLIELSIVLVIIGLLVGGVLVGQDLIKAAEIRSQIQQVEKYNSAVNTFRVKYNAIPGDIAEPNASGFGFKARGTQIGQGDGSGLLEGYDFGGNSSLFVNGETTMFWVDLSTAGLIDGGFNTATATATLSLTSSQIPLYFPRAKIGNGNYISVVSGAPMPLAWRSSNDLTSPYNYYIISAMNAVVGVSQPSANNGITVQQAYSIDSKIDDGFPQSGIITAKYINTVSGSTWVYLSGTTILYDNTTPYTTATTASATTCFDNGNVNGATQQYSISQNGGNGINCALMIRFQ